MRAHPRSWGPGREALARRRLLSFPRRGAYKANQTALVLDPGWAENTQINTIEPSPTNETSENGRLSFELGPIKAGDSYLLFMQFQINPTNVGRHSQNVELRDGETHIATIHRIATVFP